jgi:hypothetical protein
VNTASYKEGGRVEATVQLGVQSSCCFDETLLAVSEEWAVVLEVRGPGGRRNNWIQRSQAGSWLRSSSHLALCFLRRKKTQGKGTAKVWYVQ